MKMEILRKVEKRIQLYAFDPARTPPTKVYIEITGACNLKCPNCPRTYSKKKRGHMKDDLFFQVIDQIAEYYPELPHIGFHFFGEIEMKRNFDLLLRYAREKLPNTHFGVSVNLSFDFNSSMFEKLLLSGFDVIGIWPDAYSEESYSNIRTGGSFDMMKNNLQSLLEKRAQLNQEGISIHVGMVKNRLNEDYIDDFCEEFAFVDQFPNTSLVSVDSHDWAGQIPSENVIESVNNYILRIPKTCLTPFTTMIIAANGSATLCCFDMNLNLEIGKISHDCTVRDLWCSKAADLIRRKMLLLNPPCGMCKKCHNMYWNLPSKKILERLELKSTSRLRRFALDFGMDHKK